MCKSIFAQVGVIQLYDSKHIVENPAFKYFIDSSNTYTITTIDKLSDERFTAKTNILNLGIFDKAVWLKLRIKNNNSELEKWVLNFGFPLIDSIIVYQLAANGMVQIKQQGEMYPTYNKYYDTKNIVLPLQISYNDIQTIYIKVKTEGVVYLPMSISSEESMYDAEKKNYLFYGLFYGATILILTYNLLLFITLRDFVYLLYCTYVFVIIAILSYFNGFISYSGVFNHDRILLNKLFGNIVFSFVIISSLFCYYFLEIKKTNKYYGYILKFIIFTGIIFTILSFFVEYQTTIRIASILYIVTPCALLYISLSSWISGNYTARFYTLASSFFLVSVLMMSFRVMGIITGNKFQETLIELGVIIDAVLISLALADKLRKLRMDKEKSQESELAAVAEKERLIVEQNNILERKISSRTKEILEKNDQLELFSQTIKQQNDLLRDYTENLEKQIEARTKEILETNKQLERKTDRLEQFTYIVSHNLKSPVNNLDALLGFVNFDNLSEENKEYFSVIGRTSSQLINIIEEINILVKLDKGTDIEYTEIDLNAVIDNIKDKLVIQIEKTNCTIKTNFQVNKIKSFSAYITSIIYNLVSNAIKYRSSDRPIEIIVESFDGDLTTIIKVKDNGQGIAESQLEDVFKLFYKIDYEQEGKGMGLFIVKSQVELLDGKIEVTSKLGEGTTFYIHLPNK